MTRAHAAEILEHAIRCGLARADAEPPAAPDDADMLVTWRLFAELLDARESTRQLLGARLRARAMTAIRSGDGGRADASMREARRLAAAGTDPLATAVATTLDDATDSYLAYRRGRRDEARGHLLSSLAATDWVQGERPLPMLHLRRTHLLANLVRVEARLGDAGEGMRLAAGLLAYLEGDDHRWPLDAMPSRLPIDTLPLERRVRAADRLMVEVEQLFVTLPAGDGAMAALAPHLDGARDACAPFAWSHAWLRHMSTLHTDDPAWLDAAADLLARGPRPAPTLWRSAAVRAVARCEAQHPDDGRLQARVVALLDTRAAQPGTTARAAGTQS